MRAERLTQLPNVLQNLNSELKDTKKLVIILFGSISMNVLFQVTCHLIQINNKTLITGTELNWNLKLIVPPQIN